MLKYYLDEKEITSEEYVDRLIEDGEGYGQSKTTALMVIRENRQEARELGVHIWTTIEGNKLVIKSTKKQEE